MKALREFSVNGETAEVVVDTRDTLLDLLRDHIGLTGSKEGCGNGNCGACTVLLDGAPVNACIVLACEAIGREVVTIEGLARDGRLDRVQQALIDFGGTQCGFCTPGVAVSAKALLDRIPLPSSEEIRRALAGNLCRCTGYVKIVEAVLAVATATSPSEAIMDSPSHALKVVGKRVPRVDAAERVTGRAVYFRRFSPAEYAAREDQAQPAPARPHSPHRLVAGART